jgi:hypothetical protein
MSKQYPGGLITKTPPTPSGPYETSTAAGIWTLNQVAYWTKQGLWPTPGNIAPDPYFNYVTMLLHGNGSASGTTNVLPFNSDASTNAFNLAINGDARSNNFNPYQEGYYSNSFNGSSDYLTMPDNANYVISGDFTVEAWIYSTSFAGTNGNIVLAQWPGATATNQSFQFYVNSTGKVGLVYGIGATNAAVVGTSLSCTLNTWNHIAVTRSGTTVRYFVNGALDATSATVSGAFNNSTGVMSVGRINASDSGYFSGYISNCRLVIGTALYTSAFTPSTTPLTAVSGTQVLVCQSNRFIDNSANVATITVNGNTSIAPAQPFTLPTTVATYGSGYFGGTAGSYLETPYNAALDASTGPFTYEAWLNPSTTTNKQYLGGSVTNAFFAFVGSGTIFVGRNNVAVDFTSSSAIVINQWNHVVIVRNASNNIAIFINGTRQYYAASNTNNYGLASNSLRIGVATTGSSYEYNGYITDVKIAKSALYDPTASTITIPTAPLTAGSAGLLTTQYNGAGNNNGFKDSSQNNFVVSRFGNTTQGTFTPYGSNWSCYLDGSGDQLTTPSQAAFRVDQGNWTWEGWVYPTSLRNSNVLVSLGTGGVNVWYTLTVGLADGSMLFATNNGTWNFIGIYYSSANAIKANQWNHFAFVYSGTTLYFFANGVAVGSQASPYLAPGQSGTLFMGSYYNNYNNDGSWYGGYVSNLRFVKGTAVYSGSTYTVPTAPLTAITNTSLLAFQSNRFIDNSTNNFTLTRAGDTSVQRFSPFAPTSVYSTSTTGGSGYFDGTGDYLRAPNNTAFNLSTADFTIECWLYFTPTGSTQFIATYNVGVASNSQYDYVFNVQNSGAVRIDNFSGNGQAFVSSSALCVANAWNHIAVTRTGSSATVYANGVGTTGTVYATSNTNAGATLKIGADNNGSLVAKGYMTDFRLVKGTRIYTANFTPPTAPLTTTSGTSLLLNYTNAAIYDNAVMNNLETVGNAMVSTSVKKYGTGSLAFDGTGDWLSVPDSQNFNFGSGNFTIEFWIYLNSVSGTIGILGKRTNEANYAPFIMIVTSSALKVYMSINGSLWAVNGLSTSTLSTSTWYNIAVTRSGSTVYMFLNGTSVGSTGTLSGALMTNTSPLYIGADSGSPSGSSTLNGYIDDLRVTKGYARYTANFTPPTSQFPDR